VIQLLGRILREGRKHAEVALDDERTAVGEGADE
jgi:hypothetical protein